MSEQYNYTVKWGDYHIHRTSEWSLENDIGYTLDKGSANRIKILLNTQADRIAELEAQNAELRAIHKQLLLDGSDPTTADDVPQLRYIKKYHPGVECDNIYDTVRAKFVSEATVVTNSTLDTIIAHMNGDDATDDVPALPSNTSAITLDEPRYVVCQLPDDSYSEAVYGIVDNILGLYIGLLPHAGKMHPYVKDGEWLQQAKYCTDVQAQNHVNILNGRSKKRYVVIAFASPTGVDHWQRYQIIDSETHEVYDSNHYYLGFRDAQAKADELNALSDED